jgi:hypothetical protein
MPTDEERRPAGNGPASEATPRSHHYIAGIRRRRAATYHVEQLDCGCRDAWTCRHYDGTDEITDQHVAGYRDAAQHLLAQGLTPAPNVPALRVMWRCGGADQALARRISERWLTA